MLKLCKNFHGIMQKVLQSVEGFVPNRVNEVLVLISLESRTWCQENVDSDSQFLLCFRKEYFVFFTKLYILFQNAGYIIVYFLY